MIQFGGETKDEVEEQGPGADRRADSGSGGTGPHVAYLDDPAVEDNLWKVREAGLGATAYPPGKHETHEGWEDAAVPPDRLGDYLRDFRDLLAKYDYRGASLYGHFGQGCVHTRIPFELRTPAGIAALPVASSRTPPTWWSPTAARCPASTATASRGASCCRRCSDPS